MKNCKVCENEFIPKSNSGKQCSVECRRTGGLEKKRKLSKTDKYKQQVKEYQIANKEKISEQRKKTREDNIEKYKKKEKEFRKRHKEKIRERNRTYLKNNPKKRREFYETDYKKNKGSYRARAAQRKAAKRQRTPKWSDLKDIEQFYRDCPEGMVVDHYYPLQGKKCSGLHVLGNLQYMDPIENIRKYNKMPEEWENEKKRND